VEPDPERPTRGVQDPDERRILRTFQTRQAAGEDPGMTLADRLVPSGLEMDDRFHAADLIL
jgi:hypothetical protein